MLILAADDLAYKHLYGNNVIHMPQNSLSIAQRVAVVLRGEKPLIGIVVAFGVVVSILSLSVPVAVQSLVNTLALGNLTQQLIILSVLLVLVLGFSSSLNLAQLYAVELLQRRLFVRQALDLSLRTPRFAWEGMRGPFAAELLTPFLEIAVLNKSFSDILIGGLRLALQIVVGLVLLGAYHPALLLFAIVLTLVIGLILMIPIRQGIATADKECSTKYRTLAWLEDLAHGSLIFRNEAGLKYAHTMTDAVVEDWLSVRRSHFRTLFLQNSLAFLTQATASGVLLGLGGLLVVRGELTLGQLVAAELVVNAALSGLTKFGKHVEGFYDFCAASNKLHTVRQIPLERDDGENVNWQHNLPASLEARSLNAGKEGLVDSFLKDVSFSIPAGERVAICGQNGSGKSLLAELIFGLTTPTTGALYLDGRNVSDISLVSLRSRITLVRTPQFFDGTLEDNLRVGRDTISRQDLRQLMRVLALESKMQKLNIDLQTEVTSSCRFFSYGEQLRLAIGRALLGNPGLVILDQTLDGIDEDSLQFVMDFLLDPDLPCSVLALTHDEKIAQQFNLAYEMRHGRLTPITLQPKGVPNGGRR